MRRDMRSGMSYLDLSSGQHDQQAPGVQAEAGKSRIAAALVKPPASILTWRKFT